MKVIGLVTRSELRLRADPSRVISRLFIPGQELAGGSESRTALTIERVLALSDDEVRETVAELFDRFDGRHDDLAGVFDAHADLVYDRVPSNAVLLDGRRRLLGAAFTDEYALEGASVCNPSLVAHFDQTGVALGALRIILSYRSIGEGHLSAICFRTGVIDTNGTLSLDAPGRHPVVATTSLTELDRERFRAKLRESDSDGETAASVLDQLGPTFTQVELETAVLRLVSQGATRLNAEYTGMLLLSNARCFYKASFDQSVELSRRVLWPATPLESHGMEDARFVRFDDAGEIRYLATYAAYDGSNVTQQLLETSDFATFTSTPLTGVAARNKGLAIFPRRVDGVFAALSRHDRESNSLSSSPTLHHWEGATMVQEPRQPWEILQLGNCGSPLELAEGWLVLTHGVGPMRTYGIGAMLLDLDDPTRVLAHLPGPLLTPAADEQNGYVPNVVYSCGSLVHNGRLHLSLGINDGAVGFATVEIDALIAALVPVANTD